MRACTYHHHYQIFRVAQAVEAIAGITVKLRVGT